MRNIYFYYVFFDLRTYHYEIILKIMAVCGCFLMIVWYNISEDREHMLSVNGIGDLSLSCGSQEIGRDPAHRASKKCCEVVSGLIHSLDPISLFYLPPMRLFLWRY